MTKFPHRLDEVRRVLLRRCRLDAVPQVHDVSRRTGLLQDLLGAFLDRGEVPEQACIRGFLCNSVTSGGLKKLRPELSDSWVVHFLCWLLLNHIRVTVSFLLCSPRRD